MLSTKQIFAVLFLLWSLPLFSENDSSSCEPSSFEGSSGSQETPGEFSDQGLAKALTPSSPKQITRKSRWLLRKMRLQTNIDSIHRSLNTDEDIDRLLAVIAHRPESYWILKRSICKLSLRPQAKSRVFARFLCELNGVMTSR